MMKKLLTSLTLLVFFLLATLLWFFVLNQYQEREQEEEMLYKSLTKDLDNSQEIITEDKIEKKIAEELEPVKIVESTNEDVLLEEQKILNIASEAVSQDIVDPSQNVPKQYNANLDFHSQSPFWTWWEIFEQTCEEASVLLAMNHFHGREMNATEFRNELLELVKWEERTFGKYEHTNVDETARILEEYYRHKNYKIVESPSIESIKSSLSEWALVLAPFYGKWMNPYYSNGWPEYHFMLLKWYTGNDFISHDVGTKRGKDYRYSEEEIMNRMHDYHSEDIQKWAKKMIVVYAP